MSTTPGMAPCVVMVAPNGARRMRADHPALPLTPTEIARTAAACLEAGATALHLHVRDRHGHHSLSAADYRTAIAAVEREVGDRMAIQVTSESAGIFGPEAQMAMVRELRPRAVSLALRELIPDTDEPGEADAFLDWLVAEEIAPQYILYTPAEVVAFHRLRRRGVIPGDHPSVILVLGRYVGEEETVHPRDLIAFLNNHDQNCPWMLCAFGVPETACLVTAAALGGHVRVGFENSLWHPDGTVARDNAERIDRITRALDLIGRERADIEATRPLLGAVAGRGSLLPPPAGD